jgi:UDP-N-acetylglucosamine--N-acetylmuramyl-(pentapeptide) pyrophosphoryl-undecaprenol N-acetylglucosamine transferase
MAGAAHHAVLGFCDDMPAAYAACDLVICRSGGSSLAELAFLGIPAVLVPFPYSADDHQTVNADALAKAGAALLAQQRDLDGAKLAAIVGELLRARDKLATMRKAMHALSVDDAAARICDVLTGDCAISP